MESLPTSSVAPDKRKFGKALKVNRKRQEGNPVLKYIRNVAYEWSDSIKPDFECGPGCGILYLSLKYHKTHQNYVETRFGDGAGYVVKVLLALVNVDEPEALLRDLNMFCFRAGWSLILSYSVEEAAEYIESLKLAETKKPEELIQSREAFMLRQQQGPGPVGQAPTAPSVDKNKELYDDAIKLLSSIRTLTATDAKRLLASFGSLRNLALASKDDVAACPGIGPTKAENVHEFFNTSMLV